MVYDVRKNETNMCVGIFFVYFIGVRACVCMVFFFSKDYFLEKIIIEIAWKIYKWKSISKFISCHDKFQFSYKLQQFDLIDLTTNEPNNANEKKINGTFHDKFKTIVYSRGRRQRNIKMMINQKANKNRQTMITKQTISINLWRQY